MFGGAAPRQAWLKDYRQPGGVTGGIEAQLELVLEQVSRDEVQVYTHLGAWKFVTMKQVLAGEGSCFTYEWNKGWFMVAGILVKLLDGRNYITKKQTISNGR